MAKICRKKNHCNQHTNFSCANQCICGIYCENRNKLPLECWFFYPKYYNLISKQRWNIKRCLQPSTSIIAHPLNLKIEMEFSTSVHSTMGFLHIIVTKDWIKAKKEPFVSNSILNQVTQQMTLQFQHNSKRIFLVTLTKLKPYLYQES